MIRFLDGPAKGQVLMLRLAPCFLRVTVANGKWDALDLPEDSPQPDEALHAYERCTEAYTVHLNRGRSGSGFYAGAQYRYVPLQPSQETMRQSWRDWWKTQPHDPKNYVPFEIVKK